MTDLCSQVERFLDEAAGGALPQALRGHADACDLCRERRAIDHAIETQLGAGLPIAPSHRQELANRILHAAPAQSGGRRRRWPWVAAMAGAAAMAAAVLIVAGLPSKPAKPVEPTRPTALFADLFGPLSDIAPKAEEPASAAKEEREPTPIDSALAFLVGDWEAPLALGRTMIDAPTQVGADEKPVPKTENK